MSRLTAERRVQMVKCLVEGNSIRATVRLTGVAKNTVTKLLVDLGEACSEYQDRTLRDLPCRHVQAGEIWAFCNAKARNVPEEHQGEFGWGDVWTWIGIDPESQLMITWLTGGRTEADAFDFMTDLKSRLSHRVQLTTDGFRPYLDAVEGSFGADIDFAILAKLYGTDPEAEKRYGPAKCIGVESRDIQGRADPRAIGTSHVERQNLTMRMGMRRHTRLTNAFSRKVENLAAAVSLHFMHYNFVRPHTPLKNRYSRTPAMAAGVADHVWSVAEIVALLDGPALDSVAVSSD